MIIVIISADGFCRGEGIICLYIQKAKDAKRIYSTVVHAKNNFDGGKVEGKTTLSKFANVVSG